MSFYVSKFDNKCHFIDGLRVSFRNDEVSYDRCTNLRLPHAREEGTGQSLVGKENPRPVSELGERHARRHEEVVARKMEEKEDGTLTLQRAVC